MTSLELDIHVPPLGWTRSGQASHAFQTKHYFGVWVLAARGWLLFCWPHQLAQPPLLLPLWLPQHPTSIYHVLNNAVALEWLLWSVLFTCHREDATLKLPANHRSHSSWPRLRGLWKAGDLRFPSWKGAVQNSFTLETCIWPLGICIWNRFFAERHPFPPHHLYANIYVNLLGVHVQWDLQGNWTSGQLSVDLLLIGLIGLELVVLRRDLLLPSGFSMPNKRSNSSVI